MNIKYTSPANQLSEVSGQSVAAGVNRVICREQIGGKARNLCSRCNKTNQIRLLMQVQPYLFTVGNTSSRQFQHVLSLSTRLSLLRRLYLVLQPHLFETYGMKSSRYFIFFEHRYTVAMQSFRERKLSREFYRWSQYMK